MTVGRLALVSLGLAATLAVGCVDRRFLVTAHDARNPTLPITAQVFLDGEPLANTPADSRYEYAGAYEFRATAPGFEPLTRRVTLEPKWYDVPGLDLFAEVLWPFRIEDVRRVDLLMEPARPLRVEELQANAEALRARGMNLPPPSIPNDSPDNPPPVPNTPPRVPGPPTLRPLNPTPGSYIGR